LGAPGDGFNSWAFDRTEAVAADNAAAADIVDDPALYPDLADASGLSLAGYTYFPATTGYPYLSYGNYGVWSPYVASYYRYGYGSSVGYILRSPHPGLTGGATLPLRPTYPTGLGYRPGGGLSTPHPILTAPMPRPSTVVHPSAPVGHH
jgi:hypothetical protein